jgi:hypothetical protein
MSKLIILKLFCFLTILEKERGQGGVRKGREDVASHKEQEFWSAILNRSSRLDTGI